MVLSLILVLVNIIIHCVLQGGKKINMSLSTISRLTSNQAQQFYVNNNNVGGISRLNDSGGGNSNSRAGVDATTTTTTTTTVTGNGVATGITMNSNANVPPITSNDRKFTCGFGSCTYSPNVDELNRTSYNNSNILNLDFTIFNVTVLRDNLDFVSDEVLKVYNSINSWLTFMEQDFELKFNVGDITLNNELYNKLTVAIPKIEQARKSIDAWYSEFQDSTFDLTNTLSDYASIVSKLDSLNMSNTYIRGLPNTAIAIAKENIAKTKDIQRQMTRMLRIDTTIRNQMQQLSMKIKELSTGILRYGDRKELNLNTLEKIFITLSNRVSPLMRVQTQLANIINSTPINFNLTTPEVPIIQNVPNKYEPKAMTVQDEIYILNRLKDIKNFNIYTSATAPKIDAINSYIDEHLRNSQYYAEMKKIYNNIILNNVPSVLIETIAQQSANSEGIYILSHRVRKLIQNILPQDEIYRDRLNEINNIITSTITSMLNIKTEPDNNFNNTTAPEPMLVDDYVQPVTKDIDDVNILNQSNTLNNMSNNDGFRNNSTDDNINTTTNNTTAVVNDYYDDDDDGDVDIGDFTVENNIVSNAIDENPINPNYQYTIIDIQPNDYEENYANQDEFIINEQPRILSQEILMPGQQQQQQEEQLSPPATP
ncbi:putative gp124-like protein [Esparto virus]|uniref:Putative gp124-like protein n=1 Tax=Esparto virus TaxID=2072209 RepID=A0A2I7G2U7_9VIRU|nr:putative gp124-like protein [Esparto virus]AUQ43954.1 putative gp124-like protein [Esparto virus]